MAAKVHPCVPDGRFSDAPYYARSDTRHRGPTDRQTDRQHFDDVNHEGSLLMLRRCFALSLNLHHKEMAA